MGNMVGHLGNTTSTISIHNFKNLWNSPRGTVMRIQALAVVAIIITFFLAAFGSCRRWSNRWIVQKGFFAAHVLSLSLGTYSIGLMQSSSVKSQMYPIWTVSLFTLFGCIDPVTAYNGLDYKSPLSKVVYGIFLNCGYVLLMSISTISSVVGNTAIGVLAAITFIKGFHMSLALMQQSRIRNMVQTLEEGLGQTYVLNHVRGTNPIERDSMVVDFDTGIKGNRGDITLGEIEEVLKGNNDERLQSCYDVSVAMYLSHKLQRRFLGLSYRLPEPKKLENIDYKWVFELVEIELAFLYDVFFTGNPFHHYYQAKTSSFWTLASFIGICFVGVAAVIPGTMSSRHTSDCTNIVGTTTADLVITFVILVSLALLQLMHLIRSWTSNWARVAVACIYATRRHQEMEGGKTPCWQRWWMRLKALVATSTNWFDKYLWQDKIAQYSILPEGILTVKKKGEGSSNIECKLTSMVGCLLYRNCARMVKIFGLDYIGEVLWDLLGSDTNKRAAIRLDNDVKASIIDFLCQIKTDRLDENWLSFPKHGHIGHFLPYPSYPTWLRKMKSDGYIYTKAVMILHIATWYCKLAEELEKQDALSKVEEHIDCKGPAPRKLKKAAEAVPGYLEQEEGGGGGGGGGGEEEEAGGGGGGGENRNRSVAIALSKYCAYLVVSAPELLPGPASEAKRAYNEFAKSARLALDEDKDRLLGALSNPGILTGQRSFCIRKYREQTRVLVEHFNVHGDKKANQLSTDAMLFWEGVRLAQRLLISDHKCRQRHIRKKRASLNGSGSAPARRSNTWESLAREWVRMLIYAAPYGNVEAHMRRLSHGGEFITHLWALLYHLDIREWKLADTMMHNITTIGEAKKILTSLPSMSQYIVFAFVNSLSVPDSVEIATVSKLEAFESFRFYQTSDPDVAKLFHIDPEAKCPALVVVKKEEFTLYEGPFRAYVIADFLSLNLKQRRGEQTHKDGAKEHSMQDGGHEDEIKEDDPLLCNDVEHCETWLCELADQELKKLVQKRGRSAQATGY